MRREKVLWWSLELFLVMVCGEILLMLVFWKDEGKRKKKGNKPIFFREKGVKGSKGGTGAESRAERRMVGEVA